MSHFLNSRPIQNTKEKERENLLQYTRAGSKSQRKTGFSFFEGKLGARKRNGWSLSDIWHLQRSAPHILHADRSVLIKWFDIRRIIWTSLPMGRSARGDHRLECWSSNGVLIEEVAKRVRYAAHQSKYEERRSTNRCHGMPFVISGPGVLLVLTLMAKQWHVNFFGNWAEVETILSSLFFNSKVLLMNVLLLGICVLLCRLISMRSISKLLLNLSRLLPRLFTQGSWVS